MKLAFIRLHIAVFLAGFTGVLGRLIELDPVWLVWFRLLISAATMWVLFGWMKTIKPISAKDRNGILITGLIAALHWVSFYASIKTANVSIALICFSAVGFFTAIFEPIVNKSKFAPVELVLGAIIIIAIFLIFQFDPGNRLGIVLGTISALLGAIFPILNKNFLVRTNAETLMSWELTGGFIAITLLMPFYQYFFQVAFKMPTWEDLGWLLFLSWICSVWAFKLSAQALQKISAFTVNLTYNLEPIYGIAIAFIVYKENKELNQFFYIGLFLILITVALQTMRVWKQQYSKK